MLKTIKIKPIAIPAAGGFNYENYREKGVYLGNKDSANHEGWIVISDGNSIASLTPSQAKVLLEEHVEVKESADIEEGTIKISEAARLIGAFRAENVDIKDIL
ncbi:MAG: hypothetical protein MI867_12530 [Pseudomonadales bacterium]|nr:hypothetical protein [Pseudomonadales bacterium]